MSTTYTAVNPFDYPDNPTPIELARYQVKVMEMAEAGEPVETTAGLNWRVEPAPIWDWANNLYRIARPKIAAGHNPAGLTEDQVGVKDGWRLLTVDEVATCRHASWPETDWFSGRVWTDDNAGYFCSDPSSESVLRTKNPPGHYLPKPAPVKTLRAWTFETAPKGCVLTRTKGVKNIVRVIVGWDDDGFCDSQGGDETYELAFNNTEHSTDGGATWANCGTYVEGQP